MLILHTQACLTSTLRVDMYACRLPKTEVPNWFDDFFGLSFASFEVNLGRGKAGSA